MATQKRIERSDIVAPDAIKSVIDETVELESQLTKIVNINKVLLKQNPLKSGEDVKNLNKDIKSVVATTESLEKVTKQLNLATDEEVKGRIRLQRAAKAQRDELKDLLILEDKEAGTLDKLQAASRKLRRERASLNLDTQKGAKRLQEINKQLDDNNKQIKENSDQLKKQRLNVGNYKDSVKEALDETNLFGQSVGGLSETLGNLAKNPLTLVGAGLTGLVSLYASSTSGAKDLRRATTQLSTAYTGFAEKLANLVGANGKGGLLSNLSTSFIAGVFGIKSAIEGNLIGETEDQLDRLRVEIRASEVEAKNALDKAEEIRQIRDDESLTLTERIKANEQLLEVINKREENQLKTARKKLELNKILLSADKENVDLQLEVQQALFDIADIQEDNEGFRSEALTNINSLTREGTALTKEQTAAIEKQRKANEDFNKSLKEAESEEEDDDFAAAQSFINAETEKLKKVNDIKAEEEKAAKESIENLADLQEKADNDRLEKEKQTQSELRNLRDEELEQLAETFSNISNITNQVSQQRIDALNTEEQEVQRNLERQERRAEKGLENDLANQQKRAAEIKREQEQAAKEAERIQLGLAYLNQFAELSKTEPNSAALKAGANVTLAKTLSGLLFYDGAENIDDKTATKWRNTGKDDFIIGVHGGERVLTSTQNNKIGDISNDDLAEIALQYRTGNLGSSSPINDDRIVSRLESVEKAVKNIHFDIHIDENANVTKTELKNGLKRVSRTTRPRLR